LEEIAEVAMGVVYKAQQRRLRKEKGKECSRN
jgi:hypothetical protein